MQFNDLIFKELIKRGYTLEGKTRVWNIADSKLWYLTPEQSQSYLDLENSKEYKRIASNPEFELVEKYIKEIEKQIGSGPINVIDLGCGDGNKGAHIIEHLQKVMKVKYCPIDISGYMVEKAIANLSKLNVDEIIEFQYNISDFENLVNIVPLLTKGKFKKNLFLLLGYTIGNFEINELLYEIRSSMQKGDTFIAIGGLGSSKWELRAETARDDEKTNKFFSYIPLQLGLDRRDLEFCPRFKNSRIEFAYTIRKDKKVEFQDKTVYFNQGDQIIVAVAYKYDLEDLKTVLNLHFDEVNLKVSKDGSTVLMVCKR